VAPPVAAPIPKTPPKPAKETVTEKKATVLEGRPAPKKKQTVSKPKKIYSKMTTFGKKTEITGDSKKINDSYYLNEIVKLNAAIAKNPDESINYRHRGNAFINLGNQERAIEDWKKAAAMGDTILQSYLGFLEIDWQGETP
jgi:tetratricopeptide (TPR) repeat protein